MPPLLRPDYDQIVGFLPRSAPDRLPARAAWRGAAAAAVLFAMVQLFFPLYITLALSGNQKYGALAASLLVLVAWL